MFRVQEHTVLSNVIQAVGSTPLVRLNTLTEGLKVQVLVKLESMNPLGSVKDRMGVAMVADAEEKGLNVPPVLGAGGSVGSHWLDSGIIFRLGYEF